MQAIAGLERSRAGQFRRRSGKPSAIPNKNLADRRCQSPLKSASETREFFPTSHQKPQAMQRHCPTDAPPNCPPSCPPNHLPNCPHYRKASRGDRDATELGEVCTTDRTQYFLKFLRLQPRLQPRAIAISTFKNSPNNRRGHPPGVSTQSNFPPHAGFSQNAGARLVARSLNTSKRQGLVNIFNPKIAIGSGPATAIATIRAL